MKISDIIYTLESFAPPAYQESYDNAGLITGNGSWDCTGVICALDATEAVVEEAVKKGCNLIVAHHPIVFGGLKKITGKNYVEQTIITAIKQDIAIYAIHTNLDNVIAGVNNRIANKLGLENRTILQPKPAQLLKLCTFVPKEQSDAVRNALFAAGAGHIGNYSEASFNTDGIGTYKANEKANPYAGKAGKRHEEPEVKIEVLLPAYLQNSLVRALLAAHPYEEVAYDLIPLANANKEVGSGLVGQLPQPLSEVELLHAIKAVFGLSVIRHTPLLQKPVSTIAVCGGAGSFLTKAAIAAGAQVFITADVKYHEFFDANNQLVIADIGHWESEQFTIDLLFDILIAKFPTFAVQKTEVRTNPVYYFCQ